MLLLHSALALSVWTGAAVTPAVAARDTLAYRFSISRSGDTPPALEIELTLRGNASGSTRFTAPFRWAGQDSLNKSILNLAVDRPARVVSDSAGIVTVSHPPRASVRLRYRVQQDWSGPLRLPLYFRAVVDSSRVIFNGGNGLIFPEWAAATPVVVRVTWTGVPADWSILTSYGGARSVSRTTIANLGQAAFVAGRFRIPNPRRKGFRIAIQDQWNFPDSAFITLLDRVWEIERKFWGDQGTGSGFVTLSRIASRGTQGGTAFTGGFVAFADSASSLTAIGRIAAHELMHLWNGQGMKAARPEERYKWFTEGVTDYYADRFFHEAGAYSDSAWLERVNTTVRRYYLSPARGATRREIETDYYANPDRRTFPYLQGYLLALYLKGELATASGGRYEFDRLMRDLYRASRRSGADLTDSLVLGVLPRDLRPLVRSAIGRYIDQGEMIPLVAGAIGNCIVVRDTTVVPFVLGFDAAKSTQDRVVRGLVPGGPAANAGAEEGMALAGWGWFNDDASKPATLRIKDSTGTRTLTFLPRGSQPVQVPQFGAGECTGALPRTPGAVIIPQQRATAAIPTPSSARH
ncbi:MAG: hypothetical protein V4558_11495 [Gemmatimonadota bacterium]